MALRQQFLAHSPPRTAPGNTLLKRNTPRNLGIRAPEVAVAVVVAKTPNDLWLPTWSHSPPPALHLLQENQFNRSSRFPQARVSPQAVRRPIKMESQMGLEQPFLVPCCCQPLGESSGTFKQRLCRLAMPCFGSVVIRVEGKARESVHPRLLTRLAIFLRRRFAADECPRKR
jgi:hypothetical protein